MVNRKAVEEALTKVIDPELNRSLVELDMVKNIEISGEKVRVEIALTISGCPLRNKIENDVREKLSNIPEVKEVEVILGTMTKEEREALVHKLQGERPKSPLLESNTEILGIASGKGGVGKSTLTINLASALWQQGYKVGILDADIWGFSIPRMIGLSQRPTALGNLIIPPEKAGLKIMSIGFFVSEETPIIWRGPLVHRAIEQFLTQVHWGENLDYLLIDLPPGTGDVTISIAKMLPKVKMVMVTTPQLAAAKVAIRAGRLAQKANLSIEGVVENMSYFLCSCGQKHYLFGQGGGKALAEALGTSLLGQVPFEPEIREGSDEGKPVVLYRHSTAGKVFQKIVEQVESKRLELAEA